MGYFKTKNYSLELCPVEDGSKIELFWGGLLKIINPQL